MGRLIFVVGHSGDGKSTSARNLNPDKTVIINTDQKPLPFKKFEEKYNEKKGNYLKTSDTKAVIDKLKECHGKKEVDTIIIDTWSRIMTDFVMSPEFRNNKGFDKWANLSGSQYDLINTINNKLRDDVNVYLFAHPETHYDESGFPQERIAVQGKQLEKFAPESFSSIVLYTQVENSPGKPPQFFFRTVNSGADTCKTPMEMFEQELIDNDLTIVNQAIKEYY